MATTPTPPGPVLPPSPPVVYLKPPPDWEEHEKPSLPGSPSMPLHQPAVRAAYGLIAVLVALTGGLGNALFTANLPTIQGQMGLTSSEAAWLTGAYVMLNMTANLLVYKFRQQFGMRLFAEIGLGLYALLTLLHLVLGSYTSLLMLRAASGLAGATCSTLGTLYMLQAAPRKHVLKMLVIGVGLRVPTKTFGVHGAAGPMTRHVLDGIHQWLGTAEINVASRRCSRFLQHRPKIERIGRISKVVVHHDTGRKVCASQLFKEGGSCGVSCQVVQLEGAIPLRTEVPRHGHHGRDTNSAGDQHEAARLGIQLEKILGKTHLHGVTDLDGVNQAS